MNEVILALLIFISVLLISILVDVVQIKNKYVREVRVVRRDVEIQKTIDRFAVLGWEVSNVERKENSQLVFVITFVKVR